MPSFWPRLERRLGVTAVIGDVTDPGLAASLLHEFRPAVLALNAGATPAMGRLHEQSWEGFNDTWNTDVKAGFHWIQAALRLPLASGSRVLISSSGAAIAGSPLSGGYAGAKRMLWFMANYANAVAAELDLGIRFQALVPSRCWPPAVSAAPVRRLRAAQRRHPGSIARRFRQADVGT